MPLTPRISAPADRTSVTTTPRAVEGPALAIDTVYVMSVPAVAVAGPLLSTERSETAIDALVAHGDAVALVARLDAHLEAGTDHVAIQVLPGRDDPLPTLAAIDAAMAGQPLTRPRPVRARRGADVDAFSATETCA